jgi:hypothetical protein
MCRALSASRADGNAIELVMGASSVGIVRGADSIPDLDIPSGHFTSTTSHSNRAKLAGLYRSTKLLPPVHLFGESSPESNVLSSHTVIAAYFANLSAPINRFTRGLHPSSRFAGEPGVLLLLLAATSPSRATLPSSHLRVRAFGSFGPLRQLRPAPTFLLPVLYHFSWAASTKKSIDDFQPTNLNNLDVGSPASQLNYPSTATDWFEFIHHSPMSLRLLIQQNVHSYQNICFAVQLISTCVP